MTTPDDQPVPGRRRVRPYAMTGGRTRPTHDTLEIEALVATTSVGEQTPKLTVEQRAIAALCHDLLSIAEVAARLHLPLGVIRVLVGDMADEDLVVVYRPARLATVPTGPCWSGSCTACGPCEGACSAGHGSARGRQRRMTGYLPGECTWPCRHPAYLRDLQPSCCSRCSSPERAAGSGTRSTVSGDHRRIGVGQGAQQRIASRPVTRTWPLATSTPLLPRTGHGTRWPQ